MTFQHLNVHLLDFLKRFIRIAEFQVDQTVVVPALKLGGAKGGGQEFFLRGNEKGVRRADKNWPFLC